MKKFGQMVGSFLAAAALILTFAFIVSVGAKIIGGGGH